MTKKHVAILIDAENISYRYVEDLMKRVNDRVQKKVEMLTHKLAFANWATLNNKYWVEKTLFHGIKQKHASSYTKGKNSSDMSLTIYAIDAAFTKNIDVFIIVTGDSDFTELAYKLKEYGKEVIICGEHQPTQSLKYAGNEYWTLKKDEPKEKEILELNKEIYSDIIPEINDLDFPVEEIRKERQLKKTEPKKQVSKKRNKAKLKAKLVNCAIDSYHNIAKKKNKAEVNIKEIYSEMKVMAHKHDIIIPYQQFKDGNLKGFIKSIKLFKVKDRTVNNKKESFAIII